MEQLAGLLTLLRPAAADAASAGGTAPSQVTAASFPAFSMAASSQVTPGMSLLDLFPSVKAGVLLDIARHDFEPSDLYKLDSKYRDKAERSVLDLSGSTLTVRSTTTKDYPSFHSLFLPLTVYFRILTAFAASSSNGSFTYQVSTGAMEYLSQLEVFHEDYQWSAVLSYHMEFHHHRLREMARGEYAGWSTIDATLQVKHLVGRERTRINASPRNGAQKATAPSTTRDNSNEVCQLFNRGVCSSPCRYRRVHKCSTAGCGATDHGAHSCPKST